MNAGPYQLKSTDRNIFTNSPWRCADPHNRRNRQILTAAMARSFSGGTIDTDVTTVAMIRVDED